MEAHGGRFVESIKVGRTFYICLALLHVYYHFLLYGCLNMVKEGLRVLFAIKLWHCDVKRRPDSKEERVLLLGAGCGTFSGYITVESSVRHAHDLQMEHVRSFPLVQSRTRNNAVLNRP